MNKYKQQKIADKYPSGNKSYKETRKDQLQEFRKSFKQIEQKKKHWENLKAQPKKWEFDPNNWNFDNVPNKKVVVDVLQNKDLFTSHELRYMDNNSKTSITEDEDDEEMSMIEKRVEDAYTKWVKKDSSTTKPPNPVPQLPNTDPMERNEIVPMIAEDNDTIPMTPQTVSEPMIPLDDD